jgi:hypothetical protein
MQQIGVLVKPPKPGITRIAKQASHFASLVVVIHA